MSRRRRRIPRKSSYHARVLAWAGSYYASFWLVVAVMIIVAISIIGMIPQMW